MYKRQGWRHKVELDFSEGVRARAQNLKKPSLTHLLENGHYDRMGAGVVKAYPHIKPVEEKAIEEFEDRVERRIQNGR